MVWSLASGVHGVGLGRDVVFLDVATDYYCLADIGDAVAFDGARVQITQPDLATTLTEAGLIVSGAPTEETPRPDLPRRSRDLGERDLFTAKRRAGVLTLGRVVMRTALDGALVYEGASFQRLLALAQRDRRGQSAWRSEDTPATAVIDQAHAFADALAWAPWKGECLYRSFTLLRRLQRRGLDATWVFGVRTWPFHAHCWLQIGETVLDDTIDRLVSYTPILAV